jgi:subfamily B ATP-binding cassette protein MsbA
MTSNPVTSRELYVRLLGYVRPYWKVFALAVIGMAATAATEPLFPALMKPLLDGRVGADGAADVVTYPLAIVGIFLLRGMLGFLSDYSLAWVANKVILDLRNAMFSRMVTLPSRYYDNQSSGALLSKVAYDVTGVTGAAVSVLTVAVRDTLAALGLVGWMLYLNWQLTLVAIAIVPLIAGVVKLFSGRLRAMSRGAQRSMGNITHVLQETIEAHKVVKIFGGQVYERGRFAAANAQQRGYNMRQTVAAAALGPIVQVFAAVALAIIISVALKQTAENQTTVGGFVSFITAMLMLLAPLKRLTDINAPLQRGLAAAESVFELVDQEPERDLGKTTLARARGAIELERVSFRYPEAERDALHEISLAVAPGQRVALVGPSGGGKTTLANLLPRLYSPTSGRILVDGHDIESLSLASLRANIALVSQDVVLFNDSVAANIAYGGMAGAGREAIEAAARAAYALDFIRAMPQGFDTLIGENGVKLSGGQRQRLAIARAILKDAPILILDEATSALDTESERQVQAALDELMKNRTTIVVAHRLSTIESADRIVVLDKGMMAESGRHADLLAAEGLYARLYRSRLVLESDS